MKIQFNEYFRQYTNNLAAIEIPGKNLSSILEDTFNRFPQLLVHLMEKDGVEAAKTSFKINGAFVWEQVELQRSVTDEDVLEFGRNIPEGEGGVFKIILGVVLIAAAAITYQPEGFAYGAAMIMGGMGVGMVMGGLGELIMGNPSLPSPDGNSNSSTYSFAGIQNTTVSGTPISVVYGKHRIGGHIINCYNQVVGDSNYLYVLSNHSPREAVTAIHEAGHAVITAWLHGPESVQNCTIERSATAGGYTDSLAGNRTVFEISMVYLAGYMASVEYLHRRNALTETNIQTIQQDACHDTTAFEKLYQDKGEPLEQPYSYIQARLTRLFRTGLYFQYVEPLAAALLEKKTLKQPELRQYLPNASGN